MVPRQPVRHAGQCGPDRADGPAAGVGGSAVRALSGDRRGVDRDGPAGLSRHGGASACRRLLGVRDRASRLFHLWVLSDQRALAGRRVFCPAGVRHGLAAVDRSAAPRAGRAVFLRHLPDRLVLPAVWTAAARARDRRYVALGRHADHRGGGRRRHRVLAAARHRAGARPALAHAGGQDAFGDLHRVRARRAADHGAVHGERDAAAVRAGGLVARQAAARAGRRRAVRLGLHGRGGARRPAGDPERASGRPPARSGSATGRPCGSSCCRRPCG